MYGFLSNASFIVPLLYLPLYFQAIKDTTAIASAINTLPFGLGVFILSIVTGILLPLVGYFTPFMIIGAALLAVSSGLLSTLKVNTTFASLVGYQLIGGVGAGIILQVQVRLSQN